MHQEHLRLRANVVRAIRAYFDEQGFLEIHSPRLVGLPGQEPYLEPMWTTVHESIEYRVLSIEKGDKTPSDSPDTRYPIPDTRSHRAALITSPEYAMKKLLGAGLDKIYDLGPCFRDGEPWDGTHDPEFLLLEWYRRDAGLEELMRDTEGMIRCVVNKIKTNGPVLDTQYPILDTSPTPFRRLTVAQAMRQYANVDLDPLLDNREAMAKVVRTHGHTVTDTDTWDDLFFKIFLSEVEPHLGWRKQEVGSRKELPPASSILPTFLYNYPASMAALARKDPTDPRYALRTELYIGNLELANGFAELCDPVEQRTRFEEEQNLRRSLGKDIWDIDNRFIQALPGMGDAAGIAFGVDRLVMLIAGISSISELMPIPVRERFGNG